MFMYLQRTKKKQNICNMNKYVKYTRIYSQEFVIILIIDETSIWKLNFIY